MAQGAAQNTIKAPVQQAPAQLPEGTIQSPNITPDGRLKTDTQNPLDTRIQETALIASQFNLLHAMQGEEPNASQHYARDFEIR
jgi:hypothetical protein